jgi:MFS family permease
MTTLQEREENIRKWKGIATVLIIVNCLAMIPSMAYVPLVADIKATISMSNTQLGFFSGMAGILAILCAIPAGMAIKRFGGSKTFLAGGIFMVGGLLLLSAATSFSGLVSGRGVWQIGIRFLLPALTAALVVAAPANKRSTVLGINIAVSMVGTIIAQNIGAYMSETSGWQVSIQFFAIIVAVSVVIFVVFYRGTGAKSGEVLQEKKKPIPAGGKKERSVYAMPSVWLLCLLVIFACEEGLVDVFARLQMEEVWGTGTLAFSKLTSIGIFIAIFTNLGAGWCGDKFGRWNMLIVTGILNSLIGLCLLIGQSGHKGIYIAGLLIAKALQMTTTLFVNSMAPSFLKGRDIGPIIAIIMLGGGLGQYLGPQVIGILKDVTGGYAAGWIYIFFCGVAATLLATGFKIYYGRRGIKG